MDTEDQFITEQIEQYAISRLPADYKEIALASERAIDTIAICGIRSRPSHGKLGKDRIYIAPNKDKIHLIRPLIHNNYIADSYEEIIQGDLDILRAAASKYVEERLGFRFPRPKFQENNPMISAELQSSKVHHADILQMLADGTAIAITPDEIRKRLGKSTSNIDIIESLKKLSVLSLAGTYRVRSTLTVVPVPVNGTLFQLVIIKKSTQKYVICLLFNTPWGQFYLHNIQWGNISWINHEHYPKLSESSKNLLVTILAFPASTFIRRLDDLLPILNIKIANNRNRAIRVLQNALNELNKSGFLSWKEKGDTYYIEHHLDPKRSRVISIQPKQFAVYNDEGLDHDDMQILELVRHYDMLARKFHNSTEYFSVSIKSPKTHDNWGRFESLYWYCCEQKIEAKTYIEAQFKLSEKWTNLKVKYPLPSMLLSEKAKDGYAKYIRNKMENFTLSHEKAIVPRQTVDIQAEVVKEIHDSIINLITYVEPYRKLQTAAAEEKCREVQTMRILNYWREYSPYYLWSVEWFHQLVDAMKSNEKNEKDEQRIIDIFNKIRVHPLIQDLIQQTVNELNQKYRMPANFTTAELLAGNKE